MNENRHDTERYHHDRHPGRSDRRHSRPLRVLADCVNGGASVGFMQPFGAEDAVSYWQGIAASVASGDIILALARVN